MKDYGSRCKGALLRDISASSSPSRVLNLCAQHAQLFEHIQLDDKETIISMLDKNLKNDLSSSNAPFNSSKIVKVIVIKGVVPNPYFRFISGFNRISGFIPELGL